MALFRARSATFWGVPCTGSDALLDFAVEVAAGVVVGDAAGGALRVSRLRHESTVCASQRTVIGMGDVFSGHRSGGLPPTRDAHMPGSHQCDAY